MMRKNTDNLLPPKAIIKKRSSGNATHYRLAAMVTGALLALIILSLTELVLRLSQFHFSAIPHQIMVPFSGDIVADMNTRSGKNVFERDPELLWRLVPGASVGTQTVNSDGFFGPELVTGRGHEYPMIVCLGDSCTALGTGPYPSRLANDLSVALGDRSAKILNAGVPGYSSLQGRRLLERLTSQWLFDVASINFGWNDHWQALHLPDKSYGMTLPVVVKLQNLVSVLRTYQFLHFLLKPGLTGQATLEQTNTSLRVAPDDFEDNIRAMIDLCHHRLILPLLITAPMNKALFIESTMGVSNNDQILRHRRDEVEMHQHYNEIIRRVARETKTYLIDADDIFASEQSPFLFMDDGIHFGPVGAQRIADELLGALVRHSFLDELNVLFAKTRRTFSSWRPHLMLAEISADKRSVSGHPGSTQIVRLHMINRGDTTWNRQSPFPFAMVRIGMSLLDKQGFMLIRDYARHNLPEDCLPGEALDMTISLTMPEGPGDYFLSIDGVNEGIGWFEKWGSTPLHIPIHVYAIENN